MTDTKTCAVTTIVISSVLTILYRVDVKFWFVILYVVKSQSAGFFPRLGLHCRCKKTTQALSDRTAVVLTLQNFFFSTSLQNLASKEGRPSDDAKKLGKNDSSNRSERSNSG